MVRREQIEDLLQGYEGLTDHRWIDPSKQVVVAQWVRIKCTFGCVEYGRNACCPPSTPSVAECERLFGEYREAVLMCFRKQLDRPEDRHAWSPTINARLLELEREVFVAGHQKAFVLYMDSCGLCDSCASTRRGCKDLRAARPSPEAMAVDVFSTVRAAGMTIDVLADETQPMNRYALLLVE